jgi:hypothetical protein
VTTGTSRSLRVAVPVGAPAAVVFDAFTRWDRQAAWMLGTRVEVSSGDGTSVGSELAAWTGLGPVGFWDTMVITRWESPYRVDVLHTGRIVRGTGEMEVIAVSAERSRFVWTEHLIVPLGILGSAGWPVARPFVRAGVRRSLDAFARLVERGAL